MELWDISIWWYTPALLGPLLGMFLGGVFDTTCSACANGYCRDHD